MNFILVNFIPFVLVKVMGVNQLGARIVLELVSLSTPGVDDLLVSTLKIANLKCIPNKVPLLVHQGQKRELP